MYRSNVGEFNHPFVPRVYVKQQTQWEYHVLHVNEDKMPGEDALNDLGDEGWELVAALPEALYFKRLVD